MAYTDVFNETTASHLNPDYPLVEVLPEENFAYFRPRSGGATYERQIDGCPRRFLLTFSGRLQWQIDDLRRTVELHRGGVVTLYDAERNRYYTGSFVGGITQFQTGAFNQVSAGVVFQEVAGQPLVVYPGAVNDDWDRDAIFISAQDDFGNDRPKKTGVWTFVNPIVLTKSGNGYTQANTNNTDKIEILYWGYGFRLWARLTATQGIGAVSCTAQDGTVELAATNVDMYAAVNTASAPIFTKFDLPLGWHRFQLQATNTKNAASSGNLLVFDTIEVMK